MHFYRLGNGSGPSSKYIAPIQSQHSEVQMDACIFKESKASELKDLKSLKKITIPASMLIIIGPS
ncbi:hypothetical protein BC938DRAFT_481442 [Jimgerdemannia flammicorona]|uniref:Uncharacterized protein n=1 Tax=Jimgerdemannia flammicorona TaxID=994334 RepID=A0A433QG60_9FUNG|nr:hypothetical protein BC938DRAFT_481442 [Jimgerdemannia flammicorona]